MPRNTTPAFSYVRVSGRSQVDRDGFPRQRAAVAKLAKSGGFEIVDEFTDAAVSGTVEGFDRPGLSDLLVAIRRNGVRTVLIERSDRLARDLMVGEVILAECRKLDVKVIAADSGQDLTVGDDDPTRVLIRQVLGAVSQFEKSVIVQKLRAARDRKRRETGRCEGRIPFGEKQGEAATVDRIRDLYRKPRGGRRRSMAQIAQVLNEEGLNPHSGAQWNRGSVWALLKRLGLLRKQPAEA